LLSPGGLPEPEPPQAESARSRVITMILRSKTHSFIRLIHADNFSHTNLTQHSQQVPLIRWNLPFILGLALGCELSLNKGG
jgi:hypothetical protein